jgi:hypothetical protein
MQRGGGQVNVVFELAPMNNTFQSHIYGTGFELPQWTPPYEPPMNKHGFFLAALPSSTKPRKGVVGNLVPRY